MYTEIDFEVQHDVHELLLYPQGVTDVFSGRRAGEATSPWNGGREEGGDEPMVLHLTVD